MAISGDTSPIHGSEIEAKARGYRNRVVHGLLTSSLYSTLVGVHLPGRHGLLLGLNLKFHKVVHPGDPLMVWGEVSARQEAYRMVDISARILNGAGEKVSSAKIQVQLHA